MKAGIIAAGEGSRLKSEGVALSKPLVTVGGIPLIERLLNSFIHAGITEVVCIVNEYSLAVKEFVERKHFAIPVKFVVKTTPSSMHSLFELSPHLMDGQFLLSTVDSIFHEEELSLYLKYGRGRQESDGILAVTSFIDDENPLYVDLDASNRIKDFSKFEHSPWVTGGLYIFSPRIFKEIDPVLKQGIQRLRNFLGYLLKQGYVLEGFPFSKIVDVDHLKDVQEAEELLRSEKL